MTTTQKVLVGFVACCVFVGGLAVISSYADDPAKALTRVGAVELPFDSARVFWWRDAARCLKIDTTYDTKLRYFVGDTIPTSWGAVTDRGSLTFGYTDSGDHLILVGRGHERDSALTMHEQLHDYLKIGGHPQQYFDGRCGVFPVRDP